MSAPTDDAVARVRAARINPGRRNDTNELYCLVLDADLRTLLARLDAAEADARRLDWLDGNSFTAYRTRDPETSKLCDYAVVVAEDTAIRRGNIGSIRAGLDHAMRGGA